METFFTVSILMFAIIAGFMFGFWGFLAVFVAGVIVQSIQIKKGRM